MAKRNAKPDYRVYRARRQGDADDPIAARAGTRGRAPAEGTVTPTPPIRPGGPVVLPEPGAPPPARTAPQAPPRPPHRPRRVRVRWIALALLVLLAALLAWVGYGYWQFRDAMSRANRRLAPATRAALTPDSGSLLDSPSTILVLGSDRRPGETSSRSDSILLVRSDPGSGTLAQLSIPRDLRVEIPGHGSDRINAAYAIGRAPLAIATVEALTGLKVNHVVLVDFGGFKRLIDALGGITITNPERIVSNSFDGYHWHFAKGTIHLDGRHALAYSRVRENLLNPADNDLTRGGRQQRVLTALQARLASPSTLLDLPSVGRAVAGPLATDLGADDLTALAWRKLRSSRTLHCRLGGTPAQIGGADELIGGSENAQTIAMFLGRSAPQPPRPGDTYGAGCTVS